VRVGILLSYGTLLHDRIISLRGEFWANKTSLTTPLIIEVHLIRMQIDQTTPVKHQINKITGTKEIIHVQILSR
jgi:hypothetical protein